MKGAGVCYIFVILLTIGLMVWGFLDVLKKRQSSEPTELATISRQIRGFGMMILSSVVLFVGIALCMGASGGLDALLTSVADLM
jgi:hypothetical protein